MRLVVQRVKSSNVIIDGKVVGQIGKGLNLLLAVGQGDTEKDCEYLANKVTGLRIFEDKEGKMNLSILDLKEEGEDVGLLVISQFTLYGDCRKGRRPSFTQAEDPERANFLHGYFIHLCKERGLKVERGVFQAHMTVNIENQGPVTLLIDSKKEF